MLGADKRILYGCGKNRTRYPSGRSCFQDSAGPCPSHPSSMSFSYFCSKLSRPIRETNFSVVRQILPCYCVGRDSNPICVIGNQRVYRITYRRKSAGTNARSAGAPYVVPEAGIEPASFAFQANAKTTSATLAFLYSKLLYRFREGKAHQPQRIDRRA